jgi:hypothetical protein
VNFISGVWIEQAARNAMGMDINSKLGPLLLIEIGRQWLFFEAGRWDIFMAFTFQKNSSHQTKINIFTEIVKLIHCGALFIAKFYCAAFAATKKKIFN